jgi:hypothetical protein
MNADILARVTGVYEGSDALATRALYAELTAVGRSGELAVNLMRACKKSERAKVYRGRHYRESSYDGKQWAMGEICRLLVYYPELVEAWGWGEDTKQAFHTWVLYVELPQGQVSFHTAARGEGPNYFKPWDGQVGFSPGRIVTFAAQLLEENSGLSDDSDGK